MNSFQKIDLIISIQLTFMVLHVWRSYIYALTQINVRKFSLLATVYVIEHNCCAPGFWAVRERGTWEARPGPDQLVYITGWHARVPLTTGYRTPIADSLPRCIAKCTRRHGDSTARTTGDGRPGNHNTLRLPWRRHFSRLYVGVECFLETRNFLIVYSY